MFKSLFFLLALIGMIAAQTTAPATAGAGGSAVPIAVPVMVPVVMPVGVPVAVPTTTTTAKGPKAVKKAKSPSAARGTKLTAGKGPKRRRMF